MGNLDHSVRLNLRSLLYRFYFAGDCRNTSHLGKEVVLWSAKQLNYRASSHGVDGKLIHKLEAELI